MSDQDKAVSEEAKTGDDSGGWVGKVRVAVAAGIVWGGLHYVAEASVVPPGLDRALMVTAAGAAAPLVVGLLLIVGAYVGAHIAGAHRPLRGLLAVALALAVWAWFGGTMDQWLIFSNPDPQASASGAYWALLGEYLFWAICVLAAIGLGELAALGGAALNPKAALPVLRRALGLEAIKTEWREGLLTLLIVSAVATVALLFLTGPRVQRTYPGQVYFAVAAAFGLGVGLARWALTSMGQSSGKAAGGKPLLAGCARHPLWYCAAPFLVGSIGAAAAGISPRLPGDYAQFNSIPVTGLVRPLPIQMVAVAIVVIIWVLRPQPAANTAESR